MCSSSNDYWELRMNKNNRGLTALAALMATLIGAGTANAADTQLVRIGFAGPLTGPSAHQGLDVEHGVSIAIEEANQQQLKLGDKVA